MLKHTILSLMLLASCGNTLAMKPTTKQSDSIIKFIINYACTIIWKKSKDTAKAKRQKETIKNIGKVAKGVAKKLPCSIL